MPPEWITEKSQRLLETLHLDGIFEENNIPPIFLPIAIILLIILLILSFSGTTETGIISSPCGDKVCDSLGGEDVITCPRDCVAIPLTERTVQVLIDNPSKYPLEVSLETSEGVLVQKKKDRTSSFIFSVDSSVEEVRAFILNTINSEVINSEVVSLTNEVTKIDLSSNEDFLGNTVISWQQASLRVNTEDAVTGDAIMANVTIFIPQTLAANIKVDSKIINELGHFSLEAGTWYVLSAKADGYENYYKPYDYIMLESEESREITLKFDPFNISKVPAELKVCSYDDNWDPLNASIQISDMFGSEIENKITIEGCADFILTEGQTIIATSLNLSSDCLSSKQEITLQEGANELGLISICDSENISQARLKVVDENGNILTYDATIIARSWLPN